jgi:catechol 2,3-dioxygenase-like lactoylglutathione lyase family enzyme
MITNIDHVALSVASLDRSIAFYRDIIGFEVVRILECGPEMKLGDVNGMPGSTARIAHLTLGDNMLELFEYQAPKGKPIPPDRKQADNGLIHFGLASTDARADYDKLKEHGVTFLGEPIEFRPGVWIFYFYGPDGEVCELRES